ncbi:hypothetical protein VTG60DRAFT_654 [Thermothelomyces hinnuleus]
MLISSHEYLTQYDLNRALGAAAHAGKAAVVELLLRKGADVHAQHRTVSSGFLLRTGRPENDEPMAGMSALQLAACTGHLDVVRLLVEHGANVNPPPSPAGSVLASALLGPYPPMPILQFLLDSGADPGVDTDGAAGCETPLHLAARRLPEDRRPFHLLVERGANVNARGGDYGYPLQALCAFSSDYDVDPLAEIELLLNGGADINACGGRYGTALQVSCRHNNAEIAAFLLDRGADVNAQGGEMGTALHVACRYGRANPDLVRLLLDNGADVNARHEFYGTALQLSCLEGYIEIATLLLDRGADINAISGKHGTALQAACGSLETLNRLSLVTLLLEHGADVNAQGGPYGNALQASCFLVSREVVDCLLEHGANINASGGIYGSALQAAAAAEIKDDDLGDAKTDDDNVALLRLLLLRGADVNQQGGRYGTALQAAALRRDLDSVLLLLEYGAEINAEGGEFGTALQAACMRRDGIEIARLLLERGADVHARGGPFGNAWHAAAEQTGREWEAILQMMLDRGVDINDAQGKKHATALEAALDTKAYDDPEDSMSRVRFLIERGADANIHAGPSGSALHYACFCFPSRTHATPVTPAVKFLLNWPGVDVNTQAGSYGTALQAAASAGNFLVVEQLLRRGADVNLGGGKYGSALNAAIIRDYWYIVYILLAAGALPDCRLRSEPDEEWLARVGGEDGQDAVERYRVFWKKQKERWDNNRTTSQ